MKRAFSTLGCPEQSLGDVFAIASENGIPCVELRALGGSLDVPAYLKKKFGTPQALTEFVRAQPARVVGFGTSLDLHKADRKECGSFLEFLPWAEALGGVRLRVFDGAELQTAEGLARAVETLRWWQDARTTNGWRSELMVETHSSLFTGRSISHFLAAAPSGTAILWDTHHTWRIGGEDPVTTWREIRRFTVHLHVKDSITDLESKSGYTYVVPGAGMFPMSRLIQVLVEDHYDGPISLEWERQWHPGLPTLAEALRQADAATWW